MLGRSTCVRCGETEENTCLTARAKVPIPWGWLLIDGGGNKICERCLPAYTKMKAEEACLHKSAGSQRQGDPE